MPTASRRFNHEFFLGDGLCIVLTFYLGSYGFLRSFCFLHSNTRDSQLHGAMTNLLRSALFYIDKPKVHQCRQFAWMRWKNIHGQTTAFELPKNFWLGHTFFFWSHKIAAIWKNNNNSKATTRKCLRYQVSTKQKLGPRVRLKLTFRWSKIPSKQL